MRAVLIVIALALGSAAIAQDNDAETMLRAMLDAPRPAPYSPPSRTYAAPAAEPSTAASLGMPNGERVDGSVKSCFYNKLGVVRVVQIGMFEACPR